MSENTLMWAGNQRVAWLLALHETCKPEQRKLTEFYAHELLEPEARKQIEFHTVEVIGDVFHASANAIDIWLRRLESDNGDLKLKCIHYHRYGTEIPLKYKHDGRPCGPLPGNEAKLLRAVTGKSSTNDRPLRTLAKKGIVFVLQLNDRHFEVYFRSFKDLHAANERFEHPQQ